MVIGAAIALAGALITPLIIEPRRARSARAREARDELARLLPEWFKLTMDLKPETLGRQVELFTRIRFLVPQADDAILKVMADPAQVKRAERSAATANATGVIARWLEGTYSAKKALEAYQTSRAVDPRGDIITEWARSNGESSDSSK